MNVRSTTGQLASNKNNFILQFACRKNVAEKKIKTPKKIYKMKNNFGNILKLSEKEKRKMFLIKSCEKKQNKSWYYPWLVSSGAYQEKSSATRGSGTMQQAL